MLRILILISLGLTLSFSCAEDEKASDSNADGTSNSTNGTGNSDTDDDTINTDDNNTDDSGSTEDVVAVEDCTAPEGVNNGPETIQEMVVLLNALPKPTSVICLVNALKRPMSVNATSNAFSAQGASSTQSPRIFVKYGKLVMSIVPVGEPSKAIELAEDTSDSMSIKGDIPFPVTETISPTDPFKALYVAGSPACAGLCHPAFEVVETHDNGVVEFASTIIFPKPALDVPLIEMELLRDSCDDPLEGDKKICRFYKAMFDNGTVVPFVYE